MEKSKVKIVFSISNFDTSGSGKVVYDLAKFLDPAKFEVEQLPVLANEFNRIISIIKPYLEARHECEEALIKRLFRDREDAQFLLAKLLDEMKESTSEFNTALQKQLPIVFQGACLNLVERKPCEIDHHEFNRWA